MPMAPMTDFAVKDNYPYLQGFGSYHSYVNDLFNGLSCGEDAQHH